jgi:hypothetical protein
MEGERLQVTKEVRVIGVLATNTLKLKSTNGDHSTQTADQSFHFRDKHTHIQLSKQYLLPHPKFAVQPWSPWLEKVQSDLLGWCLVCKERRMRKD